MNILITGGTGYIARNISIKLKEFNHVIYSPSRSEMNLSDICSIKQNLDRFQPDAIIHAASVGGYRNVTDDYNIFVENFNMFENIIQSYNNIPIIFYTSGADCDRRFPITNINESDVIHKYPIDPYGLSKNMIVRKILHENLTNVNILRIFATFNHDELYSRFIKHSILNIKQNLPILIHQNKEMDFFFIDDLATVTHHILTNKPSKIHMNLSYTTKFTLKDIADIICKFANIDQDHIIIQSHHNSHSYSGSGELLKNENLQLIGLEKGIYNTLQTLL